MFVGVVGGLIIVVKLLNVVKVVVDVGDFVQLFVYIWFDNIVVVFFKYFDKGQGIVNGLVILVVDEFDVFYEQIVLELVFFNLQFYVNFLFGVQGIGGFIVILNVFMQYCQVGVLVKVMIVFVVVKDWGVLVGEINVFQGVVLYLFGKLVMFGELVGLVV